MGFQSYAIIRYMRFMDFWKIITTRLAIDFYVNINHCLVWDFSLCVIILEPILMLNVWSRHVTSFDTICTVLSKWGFHDGGKSCNRRSLLSLLPKMVFKMHIFNCILSWRCFIYLDCYLLYRSLYVFCF